MGPSPKSARISQPGRVGNCLRFFVTALPDFRRKASGKKTLRLLKRVSVVWVLDRSISMKSVPVCFHLQESSLVCPECGSAIRVAHDLCLRCMLSQAIGVEDMGVDGANEEALAELLGETHELHMLISS